jgi:hypothetical protein
MNDRVQTRGSTTARVALALGGLLVAGCFSEPEFGSSDDGSGTSGVSNTAAADSNDATTDGSATMDATDGGPPTGSDDAATSGATETLIESDSSTSGGSESSSTSGGDTVSVGDDSSTGEAIISISDVALGDLIITEVMWDPFCVGDNCEWIELYNTGDDFIDLQTLVVEDSAGNQGVVPSNVIIDPGGFVVLASTPANWNYAFDYDGLFGPSPALNNGSPERVIIRNQDMELDRTPLFPDAEQGTAFGVRAEFMTHTGNDSAFNWCLSATPLPTLFGDQEYGTPHAPTDACAVQ